jgi:hypothetical protein
MGAAAAGADTVDVALLAASGSSAAHVALKTHSPVKISR